MKFKIEHGIPLAKKGSEVGIVGALRQLKVGDSFVIPVKHRSALGTTAVRIKIRIATRTIGQGRLRVWRIE